MKELGNKKLGKTIATIEKINSIPTLKSIPHPLTLSNDKMRECRHWSNEDEKTPTSYTQAREAGMPGEAHNGVERD